MGPAAALLVLFVALLLFPSLGGGTEAIPETVGGDLVFSGGDFSSDSSGAGVVPAGTSGLALAAVEPETQGDYVSAPIEADKDFNALGLHWVEQTPPGAQVGAEVRFSLDGQEWGEWRTVGINDGDLPEFIDSTRSAGETIGDLLFVDRARYFQYRLILISNEAGQSPSVSKLTASYIDAKGFNEPSVSLTAFINTAGRLFEPAAAQAEAGIISRAQWGANEAYMQWDPEYQTPKKVVVHHTVTANDDPDPAATVRSIYYYHAVSLGWGDIGYNYLIDREGRIYEGRAGGSQAPPGESVIGAHAKEWNPGTIGVSALGNYQDGGITPEMYNSLVNLISAKSNQYCINPLGNDYMLGTYKPNILGHRDVMSTACPGQYLYDYLPLIRQDVSSRYITGLSISGNRPQGTDQASNNRPLISAEFQGCSLVDTSSIVIEVDGQDVSGFAIRTTGYVSYRPSQPLGAGPHSVYVSVSDSVGNLQELSWDFSVSQPSFTPRDYLWSWYDGVSSRNWVLMANPVDSGLNSYFDLYLGGRFMSLSQFANTGAMCPGICGSGLVTPGQSVNASYAGVMTGPVTAASITGTKAITSQRVLWGDSGSFEEVAGVEAEDLSDHYYWPWYDYQSLGYRNWVLVGNQNTFSIYYEIRIAQQLVNSGTVMPGGIAVPTFPGVMGGPVELQAWTAPGGAPAQVIGSQRVLSNYGAAFNEVSGIPAERLSDRYLWTWYDQQSAGATNWVLLANQNPHPVYYEIRIGGQLVGSGNVAAKSSATPTFPGSIGGPVELRAWTDSGRLTPASVIASQRVIWGPSFEEVPGVPENKLSHTYNWTWYDQKSAGARNWVLVSNPGGSPVYYEVRIAGYLMANGTLPAGQNVVPAFPDTMAGPVQVQAWTAPGGTPAGILASQRVLWQGYFNEMTGIVLEGEGTPPREAPAATVTADSAYQVRDGSGNLLTSLAAGQTASVSYANGTYALETSTGYTFSGPSYMRMVPAPGGIMQVTSYHDIPSWNPNLDDNRFRGTIEVRYSPASGKVWVVNELPVESYMKGIAETSSGSPGEFLKTMTVAARTYAIWHLNRGGKYGGTEIFHLKNSRNGNGDDQVYKGYGLEARFPDLVTAVNSTGGQIVTYGGSEAMTSYFSQSDGRTRSAQEVWGTSDWPWLQSVPDPDCEGMPLLGHGVGLSGYGALKRAERGNGYQTILGYYYTGTAVQTVDTNRNIRIAITSVSP